MKSVAIAMVVFGMAIVTTHALNSCTSDKDCPPGSCCVIGEQRYSIPSCAKQPMIDEVCRPNSIRQTNTERYYPNGSVIKLKDVYLSICPCNTGLYCDRRNGTCQMN